MTLWDRDCLPFVSHAQVSRTLCSNASSNKFVNRPEALRTVQDL